MHLELPESPYDHPDGIVTKEYIFYCDNDAEEIRAIFCIDGFDNQRMHMREGYYYTFDNNVFTCYDGAYYHKKIPIYLTDKTTMSLAENEFDGDIFSISGDPSFDRSEEYRSFEYKTEWVGRESENYDNTQTP